MVKSILTLLFCVCVFQFTVSAGEVEEIEHPKLKFETEGLNYGVMYTDSMPKTQIDIKFTNIGNEPLMLNNVRACCGTRVVEWPKEPIMKGDEGVIKISFNLAQRAQRFSRTVTVTTNNPDKANEIFRITGEIAER